MVLVVILDEVLITFMRSRDAKLPNNANLYESSVIYIYGTVIRQTSLMFRIQQAAKRPTLGQGRFGRFWRTQK